MVAVVAADAYWGPHTPRRGSNNHRYAEGRHEFCPRVLGPYLPVPACSKVPGKCSEGVGTKSSWGGAADMIIIVEG